MATIISNKFTSYALTEKEKLAGCILTAPQKMVIQTEGSQVAEQLLALTFNPLNPGDFAQQHAYLTGQLSVYNLLLEQSDPAEKELIGLGNS